METSLNVTDYPEPKGDNYKTIKVECSFTTYVQVEIGKFKDPDDEWEDIERQLYQMSKESKEELLEEVDKIEIEDWSEV